MPTYTPAGAAAVLDVHPNTVRAWTREYAAMLSPSANGRPRLLTQRDVAVLQLVSQLRTQGLTTPDVLTRLRDVPDEDIQQPYIDATDATMPAVPASSVPTAPAVAVADMASVLRELASVVDTRTATVTQDVRLLDERLRRLESRRTLWLGVAVGLILGVLVAAAVFVRL